MRTVSAVSRSHAGVKDGEWLPLVPDVTDELLPLVDLMYRREEALTALGIQTFRIDQEFIGTVCGDLEGKLEQQQHEIFMAKYQASRETYEAEKFHADVERRTQRADSIGRPWDAQPTRYLQKLRQLKHESRADLQKLQYEFNLRVQARWKEEVNHFVTGSHLNHEPDSNESRVNLVRAVMDRGCAEMGFSFNRKFTTPALHVVSKPLVEPWIAFLAVPKRALEKRIERPPFRVGSPYPGRAPGPDLAMYFGVVDARSRRALSADNPRALVLRFEWFLPIRKAPLWSDYSRFYTLRDLEALVNINMTFYRLLQREIEQAATVGLGMTSS